MFSFDQYPPLMLTFLNLPPKIEAAADLFFTPIIAQIGVRKQRCKIEKKPVPDTYTPMKLRKRGKFLCGHKMTPPRKHENNTTWQNYFPSFFFCKGVKNQL